MATKKKVTKAKPAKSAVAKSIVQKSVPIPRGTKEVNLYFHVRVCCQEGKITFAVGDSPIEPDPTGLTGKASKTGSKAKKATLKLAGGDSPIEPDPTG